VLPKTANTYWHIALVLMSGLRAEWRGQKKNAFGHQGVIFMEVAGGILDI